MMLWILNVVQRGGLQLPQRDAGSERGMCGPRRFSPLYQRVTTSRPEMMGYPRLCQLRQQIQLKRFRLTRAIQHYGDVTQSPSNSYSGVDCGTDLLLTQIASLKQREHYTSPYVKSTAIVSYFPHNLNIFFDHIVIYFQIYSMFH